MGADQVRITFTPVLVPMARGILATVSAPLAAGANAATVRDAWQSAYADETFVDLLPPGQWPSTAATVGSSRAIPGRTPTKSAWTRKRRRCRRDP